jgi:thymidylate kinase
MINKQYCKIIAFEGIDSLGKSTQVQQLRDFYCEKGFRCVVIKSPYNEGITYKLIYWMLRTGWARTFPNLFQLIHFINKIYFQTFKLKKLLANNDYLIFDRWVASMWAYGVADDASLLFTEWLVRRIIQPDVTIILTGTPFSREQQKDSYESDYTYQYVVQTLYMLWQKEHKNSCHIVNANQDVGVVFVDVIRKIICGDRIYKE